VYLIDEPYHFILSEVLDYVECDHHVPRLAGHSRSRFHQIALAHAVDPQSFGRGELLTGTIDPFNINVTSLTREMHQSTVATTKVDDRRVAISWKVVVYQFRKIRHPWF
jgi:hypothetical protein